MLMAGALYINRPLYTTDNNACLMKQERSLAVAKIADRTAYRKWYVGNNIGLPRDFFQWKILTTGKLALLNPWWPILSPSIGGGTKESGGHGPTFQKYQFAATFTPSIQNKTACHTQFPGHKLLYQVQL